MFVPKDSWDKEKMKIKGTELAALETACEVLQKLVFLEETVALPSTRGILRPLERIIETRARAF